jgi:antitoxin HigA-1
MEANGKVTGRLGRPIYSTISIHPGEILKDEIEARNLMKSEVASTLEILPTHLSEIFKGKRNISAALALKLEELLGINAESWLALQSKYELTRLRLLKTELIRNPQKAPKVKTNRQRARI